MPNQTKITVDISAVEHLGVEMRDVAIAGLHRTVERGEQLLREEVPVVTHNLQQGISSDVNEGALSGKLLVSARTGRTGSEGGTLHLPSGATREITLRGQPAFDYAEAVARGTGVFGPKGAVIRPKRGQVLLIPVSSVPAAINGKPQAYITSNGKIYVMRRFSKGRRPNPFDQRAANRLEAEIPAIWQRVVDAFANQQSSF